MSENGGLASAGPFAYAERGWPVFPTRGKEPLTPNGLKDATTDLSTVDRWTRTWPDAGIGLRTGAASGVVVLDVDPRHGGDDTLHELERQHGPLPNTVEAVTGGGGRHIYFKHPGEPVRNSAGKVGPGLDVRGDGGYVVLPPSPHESGRRYEWGSLPDETPLAEIPAWLLERMRGTQNGNGAASAPVVGETIAKGTQHATLVSLAGSMRRRGMGEEEIAAALRETNRRRLEDPAPEQHIDRIARSVCELYPPGAAPASQNGGAHTRQSAAGRVTRASGVKALPVTWLIPQRVPVGGVTLLAGDPKLGKSTLSCLYAARLSRGVYGTPATTLFASAEDSFAHVIKPRLIAAGADLDLVAKFDVVDADGARNLDLPDDVAALDGAAAETGARLVVIDPLNAHLAGSIDSWKDHGIRRALAPLARLADERDCAVMVVAHLNKQKSGDPLYRVGGSIGNVGAARSVLAFGRDPDDPDGERGNQRLLGHLACNWGSLADTQLYELEGLAVEADGEVIDTSRLTYVRDTQQAAADAFGARERDDRGGDCEEAIAERLAGGPRKSRDVKSEVAEELGCSARTVERAAARMAGRDELAITEGGFPRTTTWHLLAPSGDTPIANDVATGVATDGTPVVEPNQSSCDTSGDTDGNGCVATGGLAPPDWRDEFRRRHGAQR